MRSLVGRWLGRPKAPFSRPLPGQFQPYSHTVPDRYPWLFQFAADSIGTGMPVNLLSFGCSRGDEVFALRKYFPAAQIKGIDIAADNIAACRRRAAQKADARISFATAASTAAEPSAHYEAIFCLAVLCHGDLSTYGASDCEPLLRFADFCGMVTDFARCLKPGGLLLLLTTNFRFCDASAAADFDPILEAPPEQLAPDVLFDSNNRLMAGARYPAVAFRKRGVRP